MKLSVKRETTVGLSVLLVLLLILGVVAARRFLRPSLFHEEAMRAKEEKHGEELLAHEAKRDRDSSPQPALLTPLARPDRDRRQPLDDPSHWDAASRERAETPTGAAALKPHLDLPTTASSNSRVIQVSGGVQGDGAPRSLDRYAADEHRPKPAPRPADESPRSLERYAVAGMPVDPSVPQGACLVAPPPRISPSRYGYDPTFSATAGDVPANYAGVPPADAPSDYSTVPAGYASDSSRRARSELPGPMPARNPLRGDGEYEVQPNDSYWTISERVYGSGAYFRALAERNRGKAARPDRLPPGLVISTPPVAQLEKDYPDLCPRPDRREAVRNRADSLHGYPAASLTAIGGGRTYVVQEGDTLSSIARNELGKVSRWAEILQLNREALGKDYDYLTPGMRLVLPVRDPRPGDRMTRNSDDDTLLR